MKLLDAILAKFKKKPAKPTVQAVPGYGYWDYRQDLFDPKYTFDDILVRSGGKVPKLPRFPKVGEVWVFKDCKKHHSDDMQYPCSLYFHEHALGKNLWPFLFCGCLVMMEKPQCTPIPSSDPTAPSG